VTDRMNRRSFVRQTSAVGAAVAGLGYFSSSSSAESNSPNEKLDVAIIGVANRGAVNTDNVSSENIVALCDVDERYLGAASEKFPKAKKYFDLREAAELKSIDAVVVSTTDHTHAPAVVLALRAGKHVYCEKPLAHTVEEARAVRETYLANQGRLATQMGTQIHATENYRRVVELVQSGAIGPVREAHVWCDRKSSQDPVPAPSVSVPDYLHWNLWVGPAPARPYSEGFHPLNLMWNRYWDIGNGIIGDMGSHLIDLPYWALNLDFPSSCQAIAPRAQEAIYPTKLSVLWEHPKRGAGPHQQALKLVWYDGHSKPNMLYGVDVSGYGIGILFVGDDGLLLADYGRRTLLPEDKFADFIPPDPMIAKSVGHHREWINAAKSDPSSTLCNFDYSGKLIEHNLLGSIAHRVGRKLTWNHENLRATNVPEAENFIRKEYSMGWKKIIV